jgi:hypothetical protein
MSEWFTSPCHRDKERVVIVHASFWEATQSGLFGLLGDASVIIVSMSNEDQVNALYGFADEHCQTSPVEEFQ